MIFVLLLHLITILKLTLVEQGDHLRTCVSTRVLHICPLVVVVIEGIANTHHQLAENPIKQSPLRDVSTGEETDATAILPIHHPGNGVGRLLAVAFSKPVGDKDLFLAETNYHVLLQNLLAAAAVLQQRRQRSAFAIPTISKTVAMGRMAGTVGPAMGRRTAAGFLAMDVMAGAGG
jgi:hypothetical protein